MGVRKLAIIFTSLLLLSACSNEMSAEEKRNKFDSCVIKQMSFNEYDYTTPDYIMKKWESEALELCRHWLD